MRNFLLSLTVCAALAAAVFGAKATLSASGDQVDDLTIAALD